MLTLMLDQCQLQSTAMLDELSSMLDVVSSMLDDVSWQYCARSILLILPNPWTLLQDPWV